MTYHALVAEKTEEWSAKYPAIPVEVIVNILTDGVLIGLEMAEKSK